MASEDTSLSGLAGRYALALLELADDKKELDTVAGDLRGLKQILVESEDLRRLVGSPLYSREQQSKAILAVLEKAEVNELTRRFVLVVADNRRLFVLSQMIDAYLAELSRRRGEVTAKVTSAQDLSDSQQQALTEALKKSMGDKVQVDVTVDPALIGGMIVKVGSRMIDSSLRSKLQRLQLAMKGVG
ncbi:F0F1 ATP synthase subunit delta [Pelagibius sp. Alg239-R121]|uniref:F0F1 ATP synthase subunit delta n=1 Tax=Pelagibius sp. Alg239-R121 TaxID=2993448 RepID=UPI0024A75025|nr:F0F1 ATP synthase subunit delta [Pelagibius sp. Alg239-R121]